MTTDASFEFPEPKSTGLSESPTSVPVKFPEVVFHTPVDLFGRHSDFQDNWLCGACFFLLGRSDHPDPIIRQGVQAILARRHQQLEQKAKIQSSHPAHWTQYQASHGVLLARLRTNQADWETFSRDPNQRNAAFERFRRYTMQWY